MNPSFYLSKLRNSEPLSFRQQVLLIVFLSVPSILAQLSSIIMSYIDASMVGHLGAAEAASIGLVASSTWLFLGFTFAAAMGSTVQAAQLIGANKEKEARNLLKIALASTMFFSLVLMASGISVSFFLPGWLGGSEEIFRDSWAYFFIFCLSIPVIQLNDLCAEMLQCSGEMKFPSMMQILMAVLNIILNYILIFVMKMGVVGAALSTLVSRTVVTALLFAFLFFKSPVLSVRKNERMVFDWNVVKNALKIGLPVAFEQVIMSGGQIAYTRIVSPLGNIPLAANSFGITVESLCYMPAAGIGAAASTLCGQSFGAGRLDLTYRFGWLTAALGMALMVVTGGLMFVFAPEMIGLLTPNAEIRALGSKILRIESFCEPFYGASLVINGALRGTGDTLVPSIFKFASVWFVRIPLALVLAGRYGLEGIWFAMSFELCVRGILFLFRLWSSSRKSR